MKKCRKEIEDVNKKQASSDRLTSNPRKGPGAGAGPTMPVVGKGDLDMALRGLKDGSALRRKRG